MMFYSHQRMLPYYYGDSCFYFATIVNGHLTREKPYLSEAIDLTQLGHWASNIHEGMILDTRDKH